MASKSVPSMDTLKKDFPIPKINNTHVELTREDLIDIHKNI